MLDSEGLWAVARSASDAKAVLAMSQQAGVPVVVPAAVLAETLFGDSRDARANQALKRLNVVPLTDAVARRAAELKRLAGMTGVAATIGAIVVATSASLGGGVIVTSDPGDLRALAERAAPVQIQPVQV